MTWPRKPSALFVLSAVSKRLFQGCQGAHRVVAGGFVTRNLHCRQVLYHWATGEPLGRAPHRDQQKESEVAQAHPTLCNPMGCSLPGSSIHGVFQAKVLEWVAIAFSRESSRPRDRTQVSCITDRRFNIWAPRGALWQNVCKAELSQDPPMLFLC